MKSRLDHLVLFRTSTHAAMDEKMEITARETTVMITESRSAERKLKFGLFQISAIFRPIWAISVGTPTGALMMSWFVRMELKTTMTKGIIKRMKRIRVTISSAILRPLWGL